ncbi:MAG: hypothetical protein DI626_07985 [Micavibrio aeruginosavorus]|uniref:Calcineurin-like phosphoesterase domain-containing protein n=1 Tax=Micavibrio aeruginosavorus TaxID=349221 RepID=A0A2W4ZR37_9BACT|nr:MAG: hypothetical protein DI626_07985 [Micavibrio aeruginosavorus]
MFLFLFLVLPNLYVAYRTVSLLSLSPLHAVIFSLAALGLFLIQALGIAGERTFFPHWKESLASLVPVISWSAYLLYGFVSILFVYLFFGDIIRIVWHLISMPENPAGFDRTLFAAVALAALLTAAIGLWQATAGPAVKHVTVPLKNLPAAFDGFTIAQISDLHTGPTIKRPYTQKIVDITNELNPDLVALTGDFVDGKIAELAKDVEPLRDLKSTYGSYFVTGNHEYYWGAEGWLGHFKALGIDVLPNEHRVIERGGEAILIAGVNDYSTLAMHSANACNPEKSIQGAPEGLVKILLAHQPVTYELSEPAGFDLQLSGHTHSGQYFPFNLVIPFFQKYYKGLNRHGDMWIYVNTASGYWGPPLRAGVPPEITLITLKRSE